MTLVLFNSLTRKKEALTLEAARLKMYICGITPYAPLHVGHARCYVFFDILKRYLRYTGNEVTHIQNITDVADELHKQALREGTTDEELANRYIEQYGELFSKLGILRAETYPRSSEHIEDMISDIERTLGSGRAYQVGGSIYHQAYEEDFGDLLGMKLTDISVANDTSCTKKRSPLDIELWESMKDESGSYKSPWGSGRPGWNLQCFSMSRKFCDHPIDIHGGGTDLIFPHHEGERLITRTLEDKEFARFYVHVNFIRLDEQKMSKSIGNIRTLEEIFDKWEPEVFRYYLLTVHYREAMDYDESVLEECREKCVKVQEVEEKITGIEGGGTSSGLGYTKEFIEALEDDMDTVTALRVVEDACETFEQMSNGKEDGMDISGLQELLVLYHDVLGL